MTPRPTFLQWQMSQPQIRSNPRWQANTRRQVVEPVLSFAAFARDVAAAFAPLLAAFSSIATAMNEAMRQAGIDTERAAIEPRLPYDAHRATFDEEVERLDAEIAEAARRIRANARR